MIILKSRSRSNHARMTRSVNQSLLSSARNPRIDGGKSRKKDGREMRTSARLRAARQQRKQKKPYENRKHNGQLGSRTDAVVSIKSAKKKQKSTRDIVIRIDMGVTNKPRPPGT